MDTVAAPEQLFYWAGQMASLGWLILIFLPRLKALFFLAKYMLPLALGLLYSGLMLTAYFISDGGYGSLDAVRVLFTSDQILLAGWVHYLAFDLFIGAWIATQADKIGISRLLQAPILLATYLFGPLGLVLFLFIQATCSQIEVTQMGESHYAS